MALWVADLRCFWWICLFSIIPKMALEHFLGGVLCQNFPRPYGFHRFFRTGRDAQSTEGQDIRVGGRNQIPDYS